MHTLFTAQCTTNHALIMPSSYFTTIDGIIWAIRFNSALFICILFFFFLFYEPINCVIIYYYYVLTLMNIDTYGFEL